MEEMAHVKPLLVIAWKARMKSKEPEPLVLFRNGWLYRKDADGVTRLYILTPAQLQTLLEAIQHDVDEIKKGTNFTIQWKTTPQIICRVMVYSEQESEDMAKIIEKQNKDLDKTYGSENTEEREGDVRNEVFHSLGVHGFGKLTRDQVNAERQKSSSAVSAAFLNIYSKLFLESFTTPTTNKKGGVVEKKQVTEPIQHHARRCAYLASYLLAQKKKEK